MTPAPKAPITHGLPVFSQACDIVHQIALERMR
jgi:hypothetical protein